jgi:hypothetical protein
MSVQQQPRRDQADDVRRYALIARADHRMAPWGHPNGQETSRVRETPDKTLAKTTMKGSVMSRMSVYFLRAAVVSALMGMGMGIFMGVTQDFSIAPAHAHLNLLGWVSMAIYSMFYRAYPTAGEGGFAWLHFLIAFPAALTMAAGIALKHTGNPNGEMLAAVGSIATIVGFLIFTAKVFVHTARAS